MTELVDVILGGTFHAAVLFLVAAGLQLVFGVQKIVNLACGSFYALGAYFGITFVTLALKAGMPAWTLLTFALVLMFQDVFRFVWGANPRSLDNVHLVYGKLVLGDFIVPVYNLMV